MQSLLYRGEGTSWRSATGRMAYTQRINLLAAAPEFVWGLDCPASYTVRCQSVFRCALPFSFGSCMLSIALNCVLRTDKIRIESQSVRPDHNGHQWLHPARLHLCCLAATRHFHSRVPSPLNGLQKHGHSLRKKGSRTVTDKLAARCMSTAAQSQPAACTITCLMKSFTALRPISSSAFAPHSYTIAVSPPRPFCAFRYLLPRRNAVSACGV